MRAHAGGRKAETAAAGTGNDGGKEK